MKSASLLKEETGDGQAQVYRYIRLTELIPELLDLVDEGRIAFRPAVELSYLQKEEQRALLEQIAYADATPSLAQAIKLKRFSQDGKLNNEVIESIMSEEKPNQREKINIKYAEARRFIPASVPYEKTGEYILKALEYYHRYQEGRKVGMTQDRFFAKGAVYPFDAASAPFPLSHSPPHLPAIPAQKENIQAAQLKKIKCIRTI